MKHADVKEALDLADEEVAKESERIRRIGGDALAAGEITTAETAIAYAKKLEAFVQKIRALKGEWETLQSEIDLATPEVQRIFRPERPSATPDAAKVRKPVKEHKTACKIRSDLILHS